MTIFDTFTDTFGKLQAVFMNCLSPVLEHVISYTVFPDEVSRLNVPYVVRRIVPTGGHKEMMNISCLLSAHFIRRIPFPFCSGVARRSDVIPDPQNASYRKDWFTFPLCTHKRTGHLFSKTSFQFAYRIFTAPALTDTPGWLNWPLYSGHKCANTFGKYEKKSRSWRSSP